MGLCAGRTLVRCLRIAGRSASRADNSGLTQVSFVKANQSLESESVATSKIERINAGLEDIESIHPFTDGNGRIGRALINAVLRFRGLTRRVAVPIASVMLADIDA